MEYTIGTKVFNDWEIIGKLGEGSFGKVFELEKTNFGVTSKSALKMIRIPHSAADIREAINEGMDEKSVTSYFQGIVEQFTKEIAMMTSLKSHPNIVACEDYIIEAHEGKIGWDILIRMELLTALHDYIAKNKMDEETVIRLAVDICEALVFCRTKGLIHRDIKPGNIFVDSLGQFKLGDFGVARTAEKTLSSLSIQGTEKYMAPEVYLGQPYGESIDIYSLGMVLYQLMNRGRLPFLPLPPNQITFQDRINATTRRMKGEQMVPPCDANERFAQIILKACKFDSKERYHTAEEMLKDLKNLDMNAPASSVVEENIKKVVSYNEEPYFDTVDEDDNETIGISFKKKEINKKLEVCDESENNIADFKVSNYERDNNTKSFDKKQEEKSDIEKPHKDIEPSGNKKSRKKVIGAILVSVLILASIGKIAETQYSQENSNVTDNLTSINNEKSTGVSDNNEESAGVSDNNESQETNNETGNETEKVLNEDKTIKLGVYNFDSHNREDVVEALKCAQNYRPYVHINGSDYSVELIIEESVVDAEISFLENNCSAVLAFGWRLTISEPLAVGGWDILTNADDIENSTDSVFSIDLEEENFINLQAEFIINCIPESSDGKTILCLYDENQPDPIISTERRDMFINAFKKCGGNVTYVSVSNEEELRAALSNHTYNYIYAGLLYGNVMPEDVVIIRDELFKNQVLNKIMPVIITRNSDPIFNNHNKVYSIYDYLNPDIAQKMREYTGSGGISVRSVEVFSAYNIILDTMEMNTDINTALKNNSFSGAYGDVYFDENNSAIYDSISATYIKEAGIQPEYLTYSADD